MSSTYLRDFIGHPVTVAFDGPGLGQVVRRRATLVAITPRGHRVRLDDGAERTVAWWRIERDLDPERWQS